jgi:hypothetical protein
MARYMFIARYTSGGVKGVVTAGGSARRAAIQKMAWSESRWLIPLLNGSSIPARWNPQGPRPMSLAMRKSKGPSFRGG